MNIYNIPLPKPSWNTWQSDDIYTSEIAFINTPNTFINKELYFVKFVKNSNIDGYYLDNNQYLKNLYFDNKIYHKDISKISKYISEVDMCKRYYCYIRIIRDAQNPQFEGQTMIFKFGKKIYDMITEYLSLNKIMIINNVFLLNVRNTSGFFNYDHSKFIDQKIYLYDSNLDINNDIKFPVYMNIKEERKEKLKKIYI